MQPHRMHLRGPWQFEWLSARPGAVDADLAQESPSTSASGRVKMPATWQSLFGRVSGRARFRRRFHRPTNLDANERVWIVFDGIGGSGHVLINGERLGQFDDGQSSLEFDVTGRLSASNELVVEIEHNADVADAPPGGLWGPVAIEIRSDE